MIRRSMLVLTLLLALSGRAFEAQGAMGRGIAHAPSLAAAYGLGLPSLHASSGRFARLGGIEAGLGSMTIQPLRLGIVAYENSEARGAFLGRRLYDRGDAERIEAEAWRFDLGLARGYGYPWGASRLVFSHRAALGGARLDVDRTRLDPDELDDLEDFDDALRFTTSATAGLLLQIGPTIGVEAGFERVLVLPSVVFWPWLGSELIEQMGHRLIEQLSGALALRRPMMVPIVDFLLQNGLAYGAYELRRERMNYPFDSEPPLLIDTFKLGLRFTF